MNLKPTMLWACLGAATYVCAQQQVAPAGGTTATATAAPTPQPSHPTAPSAQVNAAAAEAEQRPMTYLGVLTREVPPEVSAQLSLPEGFGLTVDEVMPDSPATNAGVKPHDVLVKLDEQRLVNAKQLMALIRCHKKGDEISLTVISGGKEETRRVTLGERLVPVAEADPLKQNLNVWVPNPRLPMLGGAGHELELNGKVPRQLQQFQQDYQERLERFQKAMGEYQEKLQAWSRGDHSAPMPQPPVLNMPLLGETPVVNATSAATLPPERLAPPEGARVHSYTQKEAHTAANITRRDDSGEYSIRNVDGKSTFTVRDKDGKEQSWQINTEAERQAVPEAFQEKLRSMEDGVKLEMNSLPTPSAAPAPAPPEKPGKSDGSST